MVNIAVTTARDGNQFKDFIGGMGLRGSSYMSSDHRFQVGGLIFTRIDDANQTRGVTFDGVVCLHSDSKIMLAVDLNLKPATT